MRTVLFAYFGTIVLLVIATIYISKNHEYVTSIAFQSGGEINTRKLGVSEAQKIVTASSDLRNDDSDCHFAFGFLNDIVDMMRKDKRIISAKPSTFKRPFTGAIRQNNLCVDVMDAKDGESVGIGRCHGQGRNQEWTFTETKLVRSAGEEAMCLSGSEDENEQHRNIIVQRCNNNNTGQKWQFDSIRKQLMLASYPKLCATNYGSSLILSKCNISLTTQRWSVVMTELINIEIQSNHKIAAK